MPPPRWGVSCWNRAQERMTGGMKAIRLPVQPTPVAPQTRRYTVAKIRRGMHKLFIGLLPVALMAQSAPSPEGVAYFEKNIRPLLVANCYGCHSSKLDKPMGGLLLDSRAGRMRGGKSGVAVIVPGKPEQSLLLGAVLGNRGDLKMPPGKKLAEYEIEQLAQWIQMGAPDPRGEAAPPPVVANSIDWEKARQHWSFRPVQDPKPPQIASPEWGSPIDAFVKAKLDEKGLTPQPRASKLVLLRRVTYDLIDLPPTPGEVEAFLK